MGKDKHTYKAVAEKESKIALYLRIYNVFKSILGIVFEGMIFSKQMNISQNDLNIF